MTRVLAALGLALLLMLGAETSRAASGDACTRCHDDADFFDAEALAHVRAAAEGVHAEVGLSCHDCHGGDPDPALAEDPAASMNSELAEGPFLAAPQRSEVARFCGRCHSDPAFMRRFQPGARVDQQQEYASSRHGIALANGDENVATCVSCHGSHGIRRVRDPASSVHPTRVAETCSACHSDAQRMAGYRTDAGAPLPVDQFARWQQSVHAAALLEREDLSAPTCNDCHGNHGAAPPGLDSIAFVCGQCHPREAKLFRNSPKSRGFELHNEFLADGTGCADCHDGLPLRADLAALDHFSECASCHGNHGIVSPSTALLSPLPETPCVSCHEGEPVQTFDEPDRIRVHHQEVRDALLAAAAQQGLEGEERYDWLVEQAERLPFHTQPRQASEEPQLRPEFARLFEKFRLGKTHYSYRDPASGETRKARLVSCGDCHVSREPGSGLATSEEILRSLQQLSVVTASAERILLEARRGGVETRSAAASIDAAVNTEIQLVARVHAFEAGASSDFARQAEAGMEHGRAAVAAGNRALAELGSRRRGLALSLVVIGVVLLALALKIRQIERNRAHESASASDA